jgi:hypothetical protein
LTITLIASVTDLFRFAGEALAVAFGLTTAFAFVGLKSSDSSESSPAACFFFFAAALIAALPLGFPDLAASMSCSSASCTSVRAQFD